MNPFKALIRQKAPLVLPGVHDALSARIAEDLGFQGLCIGGAATGITQFALPDVGLLSFGEYRDSIARTCAGSRLPVLLDAEDGFGDAKAVTRTVRAFEQLGIAGLILEDLVPLRAGQPVSVVPLDTMQAKLKAALAARASDDTWVVGRTDAAHAGRHDDVCARAKRFEQLGVDAVLATGLRDLDDMKRLRDAVGVPLIALVVETKPWVRPSRDDVRALGFEIVMHAAALMLAVADAARNTLGALRDGSALPAVPASGLAALQHSLRVGEWQRLDTAFPPAARAHSG